MDARLGFGQKLDDRVRPVASSFRMNLRWQTRERLWEAHVVELNLVEACLQHIFRDRDVVLPDVRIPGTHPRIALLVAPEIVAGLADRPVGLCLREQRVLEYDDARDGPYVVRMHAVHERLQVADRDLATDLL